MSDSADFTSSIQNAASVIERFGGIRPMSAKTGIPVTTIQGWKQRGVIPMNRKNDLVRAANEYGIDLSDILLAIGSQKREGAAEDVVIAFSKDDQLDKDDVSYGVRKEMRGGADRRMSDQADIQMGSSRITLIVAGVVIFSAAALGAVFAVAPKVKVLTEQEQRIQALEHELVALREADQQAGQGDASSGAAFAIPAELEQKITALQGQVGELTAQAQSYAQIAQDLGNGTTQERLAKLETHMQSVLGQANAQGLRSMLSKVESLQMSAQGPQNLDQIMGALVAAGTSAGTDVVAAAGTVAGEPAPAEGKSDDALTAAFENLKQTDPQVAETFKDVAPEDMKAAVMLMGMAQLRDSLARDRNSFDQDLEILKMTSAKNDPELLAAIDRLAPKAKAGILTPKGLSDELRGLTGEIVEASLTGEDISVQDKALARLGGLVKVEKDGQQISGTSTQITIAQAQKKLDAGDVEGAVALLQTLDGAAAEKTKPLVDEAQATLLAQQVQSMMGVNIMSTLKGMTGKSAPYLSGSSGLEGITSTVQSLGGGVVPDLQNMIPSSPQR